MLRKLLAGLVVGCLFVSGSGVALAADKPGTADEAVAMVKKAIAFIKANGNDKAFAEFNDKKGKFTDRDLYVTVYDLEGNGLAHGFNPKMIGKNMMDLKDPGGRAMVRERVEQAKSQDKFWQRDYIFVDPLTKTTMHKDMYVEKVGDVLVCCGVFKG